MAYNIPMDIAMKRAEKLLLHVCRLSNRLEWFSSEIFKRDETKVMILCAFELSHLRISLMNLF